MQAEPQDAAGNGGQPLRNAPTPIVDLAALDLSACVMDQRVIGTFIPHRGSMLQLDRVIWHREDYTSAVAIKRVRDDEFWCAGHIPGRPIMPGVMMIEAGAQLASIMYFARVNHRNFAGFTRIEDTVFRGIVVPGDEMYILAREVKFHIKRFISDIQGIVRGKVVFESRITGMILDR